MKMNKPLGIAVWVLPH